jgi:hypothetical protein
VLLPSSMLVTQWLACWAHNLLCRVGQNHIHTAYFWLENHQIYGVYIRIYTVLANPKNHPIYDHLRCIYMVLANHVHTVANSAVSFPRMLETVVHGAASFARMLYTVVHSTRCCFLSNSAFSRPNLQNHYLCFHRLEKWPVLLYPCCSLFREWPTIRGSFREWPTIRARSQPGHNGP